MTRFVGAILLATAAAACSSPTGPQHLSFAARTTVSQATVTTVQTVVTVTNTGFATTQIEVSTCGRGIKAFTTPDHSGTPVWNSAANSVCDLVLRLRSLAPGEQYDFNLSGTVPNTLPAGTYFLAVDMENQLVPAGTFTKS